MSLRERRDTVKLCKESAPGVLFTVVAVEGSSYRQPGARMAVLQDGRTAGTLSGGCLEADLLRRAAWIVRAGAVIERFSTRFDDTAEIPYGLGCGGEIDVLAEPLATPESDALLEALAATLRGEERTVTTFLPAEDGARLRRSVVDGDGRTLFSSRGIPSPPAGDAEPEPEPWAGRTFTERLQPAHRLVIFGGGEDARPLARLATEMGWSVVVADSRANRLAPERFPADCSRVVAARADEVPVRKSDAVILMTHSYQQDRQLLSELLPLAPRYLGLLGARHRSALLLGEAAEMAGLGLRTAVERTHAPVGLQLGGDGPEAVALSIAAELQQVLQGRAANSPSRRMEYGDAVQLLADKGYLPAMQDHCAAYFSPGDALNTARPVTQ